MFSSGSTLTSGLFDKKNILATPCKSFFLALIQSSVPFVHAKRSSSDIRPVSFTHETNSRNNSRLSFSSSFEKESLVAIRRIEAFLLSEESPPPRVRRESTPPCPPGNYGDSTSVLKVEALSADWRGGRAAAAQGPPPVLVRKLKKKTVSLVPVKHE